MLSFKTWNWFNTIEFIAVYIALWYSYCDDTIKCSAHMYVGNN